MKKEDKVSREKRLAVAAKELLITGTASVKTMSDST